MAFSPKNPTTEASTVTPPTEEISATPPATEDAATGPSVAASKASSSNASDGHSSEAHAAGDTANDDDKFGRALRLRWPWLAWTAFEKPWVGMDNPCNDEDMALFYGLTRVTIGDGNVA